MVAHTKLYLMIAAQLSTFSSLVLTVLPYSVNFFFLIFLFTRPITCEGIMILRITQPFWFEDIIQSTSTIDPANVISSNFKFVLFQSFSKMTTVHQIPSYILKAKGHNEAKTVQQGLLTSNSLSSF